MVFLTHGKCTHSQTYVCRAKALYASSFTRMHCERQNPSFLCFEYGFLPHASCLFVGITENASSLSVTRGRL